MVCSTGRPEGWTADTCSDPGLIEALTKTVPVTVTTSTPKDLVVERWVLQLSLTMVEIDVCLFHLMVLAQRLRVVDIGMAVASAQTRYHYRGRCSRHAGKTSHGYVVQDRVYASVTL